VNFSRSTRAHGTEPAGVTPAWALQRPVGDPGHADADLRAYPNDAFDYVILMPDPWQPRASRARCCANAAVGKRANRLVSSQRRALHVRLRCVRPGAACPRRLAGPSMVRHAQHPSFCRSPISARACAADMGVRFERRHRADRAQQADHLPPLLAIFWASSVFMLRRDSQTAELAQYSAASCGSFFSKSQP